MATGAEKLKLVRELGIVRKNFSTAPGSGKLALIKRVREIRIILSVPVGGVVDVLNLDFTNKAACFSALESYAINNIKAMPEALQRTESWTIQQVFYFVNNLPGDKLDDEKLASMRDLFKQYDSKPEESAFSYYSKFGSAFEVESGYAQVMMDYVSKVENEPAFDLPGVNMRVAVIQDLLDQARLRYNELSEQRDDLLRGHVLGTEFSGDKDLLEMVSEARQEAIKKYDEINDLYMGVAHQKYKDKELRVESAREKLKEPGQLIINTILAASSVTQEQADQWANAQIIDKTSIAKMSKNGYKHADVRRDMAEFYRISGGKLRNIAIVSNGSRRANAGGIGNVEGMEVRVDSKFNKETLWHELAHHLEADPAAKQAANDFLVKRRESETTYSLRSLTGSKGFDADEVAYKDTFIHPYIGKVYQNQVTEVFSMGVQFLSSPELAAMFIAKDPEMASLIAGYLRAELTPAMKALQQVQGMTANDNQAKRSNANDKYADAVNRLAGWVFIDSDRWFMDLDQEDKANLLGPYGMGDKSANYIGSWNNYHIFAGKFKNRKTKRVSKGYSVCYTELSKTFLTGQGNISGLGGSRRVPSCYSVHADIDVLKAIIIASRDNYNNALHEAIDGLFSGYDRDKAKMIDLANQIIGAQG